MTLLYFSAAAICAGFILDLLLGDPQGWPHFVRLLGTLINRLEAVLYNRTDKQSAGTALALAVCAASVLIPAAVLCFAYLISPWVYSVIEMLLVWQCIAAKSLRVESGKVYKALKINNLPAARHNLSMIVGRDTENLDTTGVTRAAVETVAENISDGVIAPMFYIALFGAVGGCLYKAINTMDSMIGYKNERYIDFGRFAARLDDAANFIPARLSALLLIFSAAICRAVKPLIGKIFPPTFSEYEAAMRLVGCGLTTDESDITFVCTPNNPTGILTSIADLKTLARESKLLVIDECFIDFTDGHSFVPELHNFTNVIVLKAFTKIYSMAGLRLGYIVTANTELADMISAQIPCWSVSVPAQIAGVAALENTDWIKRTKEYVKREREYLLNEMRKHVTITESEANFIFFQTDKRVYEYMLERGILIRRWDERSYRIAVSTRENNAEFISALEQC